MGEPIHDEAVIDLVGEDHKLVLPRQFDDLLQHLGRIERACRIVRVDDDDCLGAIGDLGTHIVDVRIPLRLFVADVMHWFAACQGDACRPQRIVGGR